MDLTFYKNKSSASITRHAALTLIRCAIKIYSKAKTMCDSVLPKYMFAPDINEFKIDKIDKNLIQCEYLLS